MMTNLKQEMTVERSRVHPFTIQVPARKKEEVEKRSRRLTRKRRKGCQ
jgi:hypothetical protein